MLGKNSDLKQWAACHDNVVWIEDTPWAQKDKVLYPLSLPHTLRNINRNDVKGVLQKTTAWFAMWTDQWDSNKSKWWWICCDNKEYDVSNITKPKARWSIRKGLRDCSIYKISRTKFADLAYKIYTNSIKSYGYKNIFTKAKYSEIISKLNKYEGIDYWGAFVGNELAAFLICVNLHNAVDVLVSKSDPKLHKYKPNNALQYFVTRHYLFEKNVKYVAGGSRNLIHQTNIQDFLIKIGYRKVYGRLNIVLSPKAKILFSSGIGYWGKYVGINKFFPRKWLMLQGFVKAIDISKSF